MKKLSNATMPLARPTTENVLQFGEGNFLRAFVDDFIDAYSDGTMGIVAVQPLAGGMVDMLNGQDGLYTLLLRGIVDGKPETRQRIIRSVKRGINPYADFEDFLQTAHNPDIRFITSNTTEAGIVYRSEDKKTDAPPASFPGKLTRWLWERYEAKLPGVMVLSCELIDNNGDELRKCVYQMAENWNLPAEFTAWLNSECAILNTLVDRIVPGFPRDEMQALNEANGYQDDLLVTGEAFGLWVIEAPQWVRDALPLDKAGLPVLFTDDVSPYKLRKVRILNGAHTMMVPAAMLCGLTTVGECMQDGDVRAFLDQGLENEIIPVLPRREEMESFAASVLDRFANPHIQHRLESIALNSISKFAVRVLPTLLSNMEAGQTPKRLILSLAALLTLYTKGASVGFTPKDDAAVISFFDAPHADLAGEALAADFLWGQDLTQIAGLKDGVSAALATIEAKGMRAAIGEVIR